MKQHLYLIGYRGCGKTSVARWLAAKLHCDWIDTDDWIEQNAQRTIREIFATEGEESFRDLESQAITHVASQPPQVIALGGGAILREVNRKRLVVTGLVVWLQAEPEVLAARISADAQTVDRRPSLTGQSVVDEIREVLQRRLPFYQECANVSINTTHLSTEAIADRIVEWCIAENVTGKV